MTSIINIIKNKFAIIISIVALISIGDITGQISPGDLAQAHAHLEGMANCTQCHTLGEKVSNEKCLDCHKLLAQNISNNRGYHSSDDIAGKDCIKCHSDHHGRGFDLIRFDTLSFDHSLTGYTLEGAHQIRDCSKCHNSNNIVDEQVKNKKNTYLGLNSKCMSCHPDEHQSTLGNNCFECHDFKAFKPAAKFDHNNADFKLEGSHTKVACEKCHIKTEYNGTTITNYASVVHDNCTNCHDDVHNNKFGQDCSRCHNQNSFLQIASVTTFNHSLTGYELTGKHENVACEKCHKTKLTDKLEHDNCTDCHSDFHEGQFTKNGKRTDCIICHNTQGFSGSLFTIEMHNETKFQLTGSHLATPCYLCHKKPDRLQFTGLGTECNDCHDNIHKDIISEKYYPEESCTQCHNNIRWTNIKFDHELTGYKLEGAHEKVQCKDCHFSKTGDIQTQHFKTLTGNCTECHKDIHSGQFNSENNETVCSNCHQFNNWKPTKFDHNNTLFPLDGKHQNVDCKECHKEKILGSEKYIVYKINDFKCEDCH